MKIAGLINYFRRPKVSFSKGDGEKLWQERYSKSLSISASLELARESVYGSNVPSLNAARLLLRRTWDTFGPRPETVVLGREMVETFKGAKSRSFETIKILKASIQAESSDLNGAVAQAAKVLSESEDAILRMPAALVSLLYQTGKTQNPWAAHVNVALQKAASQERAFLDLLKDPSKSICVVGSSPKEIGKGNGEKIDAHDIVIRFNNFDVSDLFATDYGRKTTIWMKARGHADIWRRAYSEFDWTLFSGPDIRYRAVGAGDIVDCHFNGGNSVFVPSRLYANMTQSLDSSPSAGLVICQWLRLLRGAPDFDRFSIYGIGLIDQPLNKNAHYFANTISRDSYAHNWTAEAAFFRESILN